MSALGQAGDSRLALQLLDLIRLTGTQPDVDIYNKALLACSNAKSDSFRSSLTFSLSGCLFPIVGPTSGVHHESRTLSSPVLVRDMHLALALLDDMARMGVSPDADTFRVAMRTYHRAAELDDRRRRVNRANLARREVLKIFKLMDVPGEPVGV